MSAPRPAIKLRTDGVPEELRAMNKQISQHEAGKENSQLDSTELQPCCPDAAFEPRVVTLCVGLESLDGPTLRPVSKLFRLDGEKIVKTSRRALHYKGIHIYVPTASALGAVIQLAGRLPVLVLLVARYPGQPVFTLKDINAAGGLRAVLRYGFHIDATGRPPPGALTARHEHTLPSAWLPIDYDPDERTPERYKELSPEDSVVLMAPFVPDIASAPRVATPSSSARVFRDGAPIGNGRGHVYVLCDGNPTWDDRGAAARALRQNLIAGEYAWAVQDKAGNAQVRIPSDLSTWTSSGWIYCGAPAVIGEQGLEVRPPEITLANEDGAAVRLSLIQLIDQASALVKKGGDPEAANDVPATADADERALALYKSPRDGWDLQRVIDALLPHLDPNGEYAYWLMVGQALHHQFQGALEALEAWDTWSAASGKYVPGECERKWASFSKQRYSGLGAITLGSLLEKTKAQREAAQRSQRDAAMQELLQAVEQVQDARDLEEKMAKRIACCDQLTSVDRELLATAIQKRAKALGTSLRIGEVRSWLRPPASATGWQHTDDRGNPLCTLENMRVLVARLGITVRYNVIKKSIEILIPGTAFTRDNRDNAAIAHVLSECEKVRMSTRHVAQYLITLADENQHNPVATWIESRPWDGVSRLQAFYDTVQTAPGDTMKELLLKKWLVQCVAAAFSPDGIAGQGVLTFVGPQNIGKTTWFQRLAPPELDVILTGHTLDTRSKDSVFIALSFWIVELGEVDATMRKSDISALKSFVTAPMDKIRRPYAATESSFGRRTAFGATVNDQQFLHDPTGNRRFWTIEVEGFDFDHDIDMQQLWAEVRVLWQEGKETWWLDRTQVDHLNVQNRRFTSPHPIDERISSGFAWPQSDAQEVQWDWVTATEACMRVGIKEPKQGDVTRAAVAIRRLNGGMHRDSNGRSLLAVPSDASEFLD